MGTRYLKAVSDVENGSAWSKAGSVPAASFWQSLDGDSGTNPPTTDSDVDYASAGNASLPGGAPNRLRVRLLAAASGTGIPLKKKAHAVKWTWRRAGAGSLLVWPKASLWCDGVLIATETFGSGDPGTTYVTRTWNLSEAQAALIDWTKSIDVSWSDPTKGSASAACRITTVWMEFPSAWSMEASGSSSFLGDADGFLLNGTASGSSSFSGVAIGQIVNVSASGSSEFNGEAEGQLISGVASGTSSFSGRASGSPSIALVASGNSSFEGEVEATLVYGWARGRATSAGTGGGAQAARGA